MTYKFVITDHFKRQVKALVKKDRSVKERLIAGLKAFNRDRAVHIGRGVYKMRLGGADHGKSGGYRVYLLVAEADLTLAPLCIYAKSERESISMAILAEHLEKVHEEIVRAAGPG